MEKNKKKQEFALDEKKTAQQQARKELEQLKTKFVNLLMRNGEKSKAQKLFELSLNQLQSTDTLFKDENSGVLCEKKHQDFFENFKNPFQKKNTKKTSNTNDRDFLKNNILYQAVENVKPTLELRRVRKGGTTYQVPAIVNQKRQEKLAIKWIIESAEKRKKNTSRVFSDCLVKEIVEAFNKTGQPRQKRDEQLKIAEYNRAYTRYRWW